MEKRIPVIRLIVPLFLLVVGAIIVGAVFGASKMPGILGTLHSLARSFTGLFFIVWGVSFANSEIESVIWMATDEERRRLTDPNWIKPAVRPPTGVEAFVRNYQVLLTIALIMLGVAIAVLGDAPSCDMEVGLGGPYCENE